MRNIRTWKKRFRSAAAIACFIALQAYPFMTMACGDEKAAFSGEVKAGEPFIRAITPGLFFHLEPDSAGWKMSINGITADGGADYILGAHAPLRGLAIKEQKFGFILNPADDAHIPPLTGQGVFKIIDGDVESVQKPGNNYKMKTLTQLKFSAEFTIPYSSIKCGEK